MPFLSDSFESKPEKTPTETFIASLAVFLVTFLVLLFMSHQIEKKSKSFIDFSFKMLADERMGKIKTRFASELTRVTSTKRFIENSDNTTPAEFGGFVSPFSQYGGVFLFVKKTDKDVRSSKSTPETNIESTGFDYAQYIRQPIRGNTKYGNDSSFKVIYSPTGFSKIHKGLEFAYPSPLAASFVDAASSPSTLVSPPIQLGNGSPLVFFVAAIDCPIESCNQKTAFVASAIAFSDLVEADIPASSASQISVTLDYIDKNGNTVTVYENGIPPSTSENLQQSQIIITEGFQYKITATASDAFVLTQGEEYKNSYQITLSLVVSTLLALMFYFLSNQTRRTSKLIWEKTRELETLNRTDALTGIRNRRYFDEAIERLIDSIHPIFIKHGLIALDVDNFKKINDNFGHNSGDVVLSEISKVISNNLRVKDSFCRVGGEEFFIICPDTGVIGCMVLAEKLRQAVESHTFPIETFVTISLGITEFTHGESVKVITDRADKALYRAKTAGRNRVEVHI